MERGVASMPSIFPQSMRVARHVGLLALVPALGVCSSDGTSVIQAPATPIATSVTVSPATMSLVVDGTQSLAATEKDQSGNVMPDQLVEWSTNSPAVALVSS